MTAVPSSEPPPAAPDGYPLTMTTLDGEVIEATAEIRVTVYSPL